MGFKAVELKEMQTVWTLDEGVALVRYLQGKIADNKCTIALGGSVLKQGYSYKDLDIIIHPLECEDTTISDFDFTGVENCLSELGLKFVRRAHIVEYSERNVQIWDYSGKRVDIFFMLA